MTINWRAFSNFNDYLALINFRYGLLSVNSLINTLTSENAKREARKLKYIPVKNARYRASKGVLRLTNSPVVLDQMSFEAL